MKNFAIFLGFVLLCSSVAFAVDEQQLNYEHLWLGQWCTGWTSGDSEQMGYPIQLGLHP